MKKAGKLWILDNDKFFADRLKVSGDKFEYDKLLKALSFVDDFNVAVDIGAHYGTWSRQLANRFDQVIAIEGRQKTFECLTKNTQEFNNVELRFNAVGDRFDNVTIDISSKWTGRDGNSGIATFVGDGTTPMIPLDSLNIQMLDFLKVDIEGYELFALKGAEQTLKRCKPVIIFEENRRCEEHGIQRGETGKYLEWLGFEQVAVYPGKDFVYKWKK